MAKDCIHIEGCPKQAKEMDFFLGLQPQLNTTELPDMAGSPSHVAAKISRSFDTSGHHC